MEIEDPEKVYVGDSTSLWIYIPAEKRAIRQKMTGMPSYINPDEFLSGYEDRYTAVLSADSGKTYEVTLTPIDETDVYEKIVISVSKKTFEITSLSIHDGVGSENKYIFETFETNKHISKNMFVFDPPDGTQIDEY